jgi:hypothetical protein
LGSKAPKSNYFQGYPHRIIQFMDWRRRNRLSCFRNNHLWESGGILNDMEIVRNNLDFWTTLLGQIIKTSEMTEAGQ